MGRRGNYGKVRTMIIWQDHGSCVVLQNRVIIKYVDVTYLLSGWTGRARRTLYRISHIFSIKRRDGRDNKKPSQQCNETMKRGDKANVITYRKPVISLKGWRE